MTAYVIAHLQEAAPHPEIAEYIERIPATFEPYGGRCLVRGTAYEVREDSRQGDVVMSGSTGVAEARAWWASPAYRAIAPLRSRHIAGDIVLVDGVPERNDPAVTARALREAPPAG